MTYASTVPTGTSVQPHLFFGRRCEEALAFCSSALGAQVDLVMHLVPS